MSAENLNNTSDGAAEASGSTSTPSETTSAPATDTATVDTPSSETRPNVLGASTSEGEDAPAPQTTEDAVGAAQTGSSEMDAETSDGIAAVESAASEDDAATEGDGKKKRRRRRRKNKKPEGQSGAPPTSERAPFHVGEEVFGKVTAVLPDAIMVDLAGKALAIFDRLEMEADDLIPAGGDRFLARVHRDGARGGLIVLTRKPLREEETKAKVEQALKTGQPIAGLITGVIRGGVDVDIEGLRAFAPASGMDLHPQNANFASLVGTRMDFKVTQYEHNGRDVVVTRRPMLESEAHERRKRALTLLEPGRVLGGVVRTVVEWGVFVALPDAENLEGLVHATEATHDSRAKLPELFKAGDKFDVQITKIDERGKIWLSRKALVPDPWKEAKEKYPQGGKFSTVVTRVEKFGAFCQLDGLEGLIHVSDLTLNKVEHANEVIKPGDELEVIVHQFDLRSHKVALHPALTGAQAEEQSQRVAKNAALNVEVVKAEPAGLIVRILGVTGRGARGFVPAGQTGTERGSDLRKHFPVGQKLRVSVLEIDPRRGEPKLSVRRLHENEERQAHNDYRKKVAAESKFGTLGDLLKKSLGQ